MTCTGELPLAPPRQSRVGRVLDSQLNRGRADWAFLVDEDPNAAFVTEVKLTAGFQYMQLERYADRKGSHRSVLLLARHFPPWVDLSPRAFDRWLGVCLWYELIPQLREIQAREMPEWAAFLDSVAVLTKVPEVSWQLLFDEDHAVRTETAVELLERNLAPRFASRELGQAARAWVRLGDRYSVLPEAPRHARERAPLRAVSRRGSPHFNLYLGRVVRASVEWTVRLSIRPAVPVLEILRRDRVVARHQLSNGDHGPTQAVGDLVVRALQDA